MSDDDAILATGDRVSYAELLLEFSQRASGQPNWVMVPMARRQRPERRIRRVLNSNGIPRRLSRWSVAATLALGAPICTLPDDRVDEDGVWSDGPLWIDFGHRAAVLGIIWSRVEEVMPFLVRTANSLGLVVFGWGGPAIYRPEKGRPS